MDEPPCVSFVRKATFVKFPEPLHRFFTIDGSNHLSVCYPFVSVFVFVHPSDSEEVSRKFRFLGNSFRVLAQQVLKESELLDGSDYSRDSVD